MEPTLLGDYKYGLIPKSVANLLEHFRWSKITPDKNDILVGFLHILMLESGFIDKDCTEIIADSDFNYKRLLRHSRNLPPNWKRPGSYRLDFMLKSAPDITCTLICMSVSDDLLVNCTVNDIARFSTLLDPLSYFASSRASQGAYIFQNLDQLSRRFKDMIAFPAKVCIVNASDNICGCFQHLPPELQIKVMSYLTPPDIMNLARTCRHLCKSAINKPLWLKVIDSDCRKKNQVKSVASRESLYRRRYKKDLVKILTQGPTS